MSFIQRWHDRRTQERYLNGYDWAAGALLRRRLTPRDLADRAKNCDNHPFTAGVLAACRDYLKELK